MLVAVGGGGLIGGIAAWFAGRIRIVAVEPEGAPTLHRAFEAGRPVDAPAEGIAADSLAPKRVGEMMFPIAEAYVERSILVSDDDIIAAQKALWDGCGSSPSRAVRRPSQRCCPAATAGAGRADRGAGVRRERQSGKILTDNRSKQFSSFSEPPRLCRVCW